MRKVFIAMLMVCFLIIPARAEDIANQIEEGTASERENRIIVTTLDELKAAIAEANDGDTIELTQKIRVVNEYISADKDITITCTEDFADSAMFEVIGSSVIGLSFKGGGTHQIFAVTYFYGQEVIVQNCIFDGNNTSTAIDVYGSEGVNKVRIIDCEFKNCLRSAISARASTDVVMNRCYVHETYAVDASAAVESSGKITLNDCVITRNSSFANAGVLCSGTLIVSRGQIRDNTIRSTDVGVAVDIFCSGTWSIIDEGTEDTGYYDAATGAKLDLPIYESGVLARLIYLKDEVAEDYFSFLSESGVPETPPQEPISPPVGDGGDDIKNPSQPPQEPAQPSEGEGKDNSNEQPGMPAEPPQGSDGDGSDDAPSQLPEQPEKPPLDDDAPDNNSGSASDAPQEPQTPTNGDGDNDMPSTDYRPSWRPIWPTVSVEPTDTHKPQEPSDSPPAPAQPSLVCNGATIDVSRSVVLLGYGDGLLHRDDFLTRAQMATVIFRLLDDDSIALYRNAQLTFVDIPANAWYTDYVRVIQAAGIVNGVGGGRYDPEGLLTWGQTLTILSRFVKPQEYALQYIQYDGWASQAIQTAVAYGWIEDSAVFAPDAVISRGQLETLINGVLAQYR